MKFFVYILIFVGFTAIMSCTEEPTVDSRLLAMEAWIDNDGYPVVILTKVLAPSATPVDIKEAVVRWGKVSITDGVDTVVMTGSVDYTVFPPYSYREFKMKGEVGKTYTIICEYEGTRITATSRILEPPVIESVTFTPLAANDTLYTGEVRFRPAESADTGRYVVFIKVINKESRHYPSMLGTVSVAPGNDEATVPLYRGAHVMESYQAYFSAGDTVDLILAHVDDRVYGFWDGYQNAVYFGSNIFLTTSASLPSNVVGGYGIFSARATSRREAIVKTAEPSIRSLGCP